MSSETTTNGRETASPVDCVVMPDESPIQKHLFRFDDETTFKRQYAIQFLASLDAVNYQDNCRRGWKTHKPAVEDAEHLADKAWDEWKETIGLVG